MNDSKLFVFLNKKKLKWKNIKIMLFTKNPLTGFGHSFMEMVKMQKKKLNNEIYLFKTLLY